MDGVRWLRDVEARSWVDLVLVSAVTAVLGIRGYLQLTGYPKVGGESLHVAHMLWGGLLMLAALLLLLSFIGRRVRPVAAVIGGLGFGTFIDEVGKFLTHDNDYFFRPAAAIIYAVFVLLYLGARALERRRAVRPVDHVATALRDLEEALVGDLDAHEKDRILTHLERSGSDLPLVRAVRDLVEDAELVPVSPPGWSSRFQARFWIVYQRVAESAWFVRGLILFFVGQLAVKLAVVGGLLWQAWRHASPLALSWERGVIEWGLLTSSVLSGAFVGLGVHALLRGRRIVALRRFQASVLVTLLLAQVFQFHLQQWSALTGLAFHVLVFFALRFAIDHQRGEERRVLA